MPSIYFKDLNSDEIRLYDQWEQHPLSTSRSLAVNHDMTVSMWRLTHYYQSTLFIPDHKIFINHISFSFLPLHISVKTHSFSKLIISNSVHFQPSFPGQSIHSDAFSGGGICLNTLHQRQKYFQSSSHLLDNL